MLSGIDVPYLPGVTLENPVIPPDAKVALYWYVIPVEEGTKSVVVILNASTKAFVLEITVVFETVLALLKYVTDWSTNERFGNLLGTTNWIVGFTLVLNTQQSATNIKSWFWSAVHVCEFCDKNKAPTYGAEPILVIVDGVLSVGRFLTEDDKATSPDAAVHNVYSSEFDLTIKAYNTPDWI